MAGEPIRAAGLLVYRFVEEFQYLLLQASGRRRDWSPPKGHVDPGEDLMETATRETDEEAGLDANSYQVDKEHEPFVLKYEARGKPKEVYYWLAKLKNPGFQITLSREHQDFCWVNVDQAMAITYPDLGQAIRKADKYLREKPKLTGSSHASLPPC